MVGAGLSRNAVVPSGRSVPLWQELGEAVAEDVPDYVFSSSVDALSAYEYTFGRGELMNRLGSALLVDEAQPGPVHIAFCRLPFDRVITTNFDFLLDKGYERLGVGFEPIALENHLAIPGKKHRTTLVKVHGDLRHSDQMVVTEEDYDSFLGRHPVFATYLSSLLIERMPIFIGYSLEDPDLRQLMLTMKDRLGATAPVPYAIAVGMAKSDIARFERRGVRVINLPGNRKNYGSILTDAFVELFEYWDSEVLDQVDLVRDRPLEQLRVAGTEKSSRLCFFSVPRHLQAFYEDELFPLAEQADMVPVSGFDVAGNQGNLIAAVRAIIERSRFAVVDVTEGSGSVDLRMALDSIPPEDVLIIAAESGPPPFVDRAMQWVVRPADLEADRLPFFDAVAEWFSQRQLPEEPGFNPRVLLDLGQFDAAVVAAITDLEMILSRFDEPYRDGSQKRARRSPWQGLSGQTLDIPDSLRARLQEAIARRNSVVHGRASVDRHAAEEIVQAVEELRSWLHI